LILTATSWCRCDGEQCAVTTERWCFCFPSHTADQARLLFGPRCCLACSSFETHMERLTGWDLGAKQTISGVCVYVCGCMRVCVCVCGGPRNRQRKVAPGHHRKYCQCFACLPRAWHCNALPCLALYDVTGGRSASARSCNGWRDKAPRTETMGARPHLWGKACSGWHWTT
jgi:hypothetical protein